MGTCALIEEIMIGEDKVSIQIEVFISIKKKAIKFSGCARNEACSIVLRGASSHILDEVERSLHDALCVLINTVKSSRVVWGGGNSEMQMAAACDELSKKVVGK